MILFQVYECNGSAGSYLMFASDLQIALDARFLQGSFAICDMWYYSIGYMLGLWIYCDFVEKDIIGGCASAAAGRTCCSTVRYLDRS